MNNTYANVPTVSLWGDRIFGQLSFLDPKETWSFITWMIFLAYQITGSNHNDDEAHQVWISSLAGEIKKAERSRASFRLSSTNQSAGNNPASGFSLPLEVNGYRT